jgi:hypothetical protein
LVTSTLVALDFFDFDDLPDFAASAGVVIAGTTASESAAHNARDRPNFFMNTPVFDLSLALNRKTFRRRALL